MSGWKLGTRVVSVTLAKPVCGFFPVSTVDLRCPSQFWAYQP